MQYRPFDAVWFGLTPNTLTAWAYGIKVCAGGFAARGFKAGRLNNHS